MNILEITKICFISIYNSYLFLELFISIDQMHKSKILMMEKRTDIRCIVIKDFIELLKDDQW